MRVLKNFSLDDLEIIGSEIKSGKIVIFPTETIYGVGTSAFNEDAIKRIYEIKGRPEQKPLIVLINDYQMLTNIVDISSKVENKLMDMFWPGPLTIVFNEKKNSILPRIVTAGTNTVAIRMTNNKIVQTLIEKSGVPIVAPSANLSGVNNAMIIEEIKKDLGDKVDYIIDNGDILDDTPSTIVKVVDDEIMILREGKIKKEQLLKISSIK